MANRFSSLLFTRRETLTGALALAAFPQATARAGIGTSPLVLRHSVSGPEAAAALVSFKRAIRAMLALPPTDPRNWYRQAIIHLIDCPHGNWWFLPWHRAYLFHFEGICRELSGDAAFALPFWDWTREPRVPDVMFDDVLTPTHALYEESFATFRPKFETAISQMWNAFAPQQRTQLDLRGYASVDDLWAKLESYFAERSQARGLMRANPDLPDWAKTEVGEERVEAALAPKRFEDFGSSPSDNHHQRAIQNTLEAGPHNNIHNAVGYGPGFMSELMAPVDPIFWLHHANVDRLWDLWTRREQQAGRTGLPDDVARWNKEPFPFFAEPDALSERYLETSALGYRYGEGFGDAILQESHGTTAPEAQPQDSGAATFEGEKVHAALRTDAEASAAVRVPAALLAAARKKKKKRGSAHSTPGVAAPHEEEPELVAQVTLAPPREPHAVRVLFFMNCGYLSPETPVSDPHYVGSLTFFGLHNGHHGATQIIATIPLNATLQRIAEAGQPVMRQVKLQGIATRDNGEHKTLDGALVQVTVKTV